MESQNLTFHDLDYIVSTSGPGSFTGIRLGIATAVGLSLASGVPACAFNVLDWYAQSYAADNPDVKDIAVLLESKRADVYVQFFDCHGHPKIQPTCLEWNEVCNLIQNPTVFIGTAGIIKSSSLENHGLLEFNSKFSLNAADLCLYAQNQINRFGVAPFPCEPLYVTQPHITSPKS